MFDDEVAARFTSTYHHTFNSRTLWLGTRMFHRNYNNEIGIKCIP